MKWKHTLALTVILANQVVAPFALGSVEQQNQSMVTGWVVPTAIEEKETFTFAASGALAGEVVTIQTVEGQVVEKKTTDEWGRILVVGGLAAGLYLATRQTKSGKTEQCPIEIKPLQLASTSPNLTIDKIPDFASAQNGLVLQGTGMSGNAKELALTAGGTEVPVLASTRRGLKTGPIQNLAPGEHDFTLKNTATGQRAALDNVKLYSITARLTQERVGNSQVTFLEMALSPATWAANAQARIVSGPVHFEGGEKETLILIRNGAARVPIIADATGSGPFNVDWSLAGIWMAPPEGGANANPGQDLKRDPCPSEEHIPESTGGWQKEDVRVWDPVAKKWKMEYRLRRILKCHIHSGCKKEKGHKGAHDYSRKKRCDKREPFTDSNGNGTWDENDGAWDPKKDDKNGNGKPDPGEYPDNNGDGKYNPPEKFEDKDKDGKWHGDPAEEHKFGSKAERDKFQRENP